MTDIPQTDEGVGAGFDPSRVRAVSELAANPEALADEYVDLCRELGCIVKPGLALEFAKTLRRQLGKAHARERELIRTWDQASPTERQELDRLRRGWGPSSPTERERRRGDVASCLQALSIAMSDLVVGEDEDDDVPEEALDRLDEAYDRISKQHAAVAGILHALVADPQEWPDIVAAEERGEARARAALAAGTPDTPDPQAPQETAEVRLRPMETAPQGVPIVARHKPTPAMPNGWVATVLLGNRSNEPDEALSDTILHYNGNVLVGRFYGGWTGWLHPAEFTALGSSWVSERIEAGDDAWGEHVRQFAALILHGDEEHRGWLQEAAEAYVVGDPMPAPRGKGTAAPPPVSPPTTQGGTETLREAADELKWLRDQLFVLCEATEDATEDRLAKAVQDHEKGFHRGAAYEAKAIRRAVAEVVRVRLQEIAAPSPSHEEA